MNTVIKDAWVIFKKDIKIEKFMVIVSIIFMGYIGVMISTLIGTQYDHQNEIIPAADVLLLTLIPMLGFYFSKKSFKYMTEDSYTQMLIYLRTLPISPKVIMCYRYIQMLIAFTINSVIVFSIIYGVSYQLRSEMSIGNYICFALTWIGYALAVTGFYIHFEFTSSGRKYFWLSMVMMVVTAIVGITNWLLGGNMFLYTVKMSKEWGILSPVMWISLIGGMITLALLGKLTFRKLQHRDLL
ncbi:hypothetical protein [Paenibacillus glacialis]|uniref:ABC transporter permease n=1 Tax=Paenibacillus glacialis TaxID=494026 RepID=A0A168N691_9BACL|nr:hypothetical protein [Paenibacillus glacialis]OAB45440.1 hypothetical protein PGLA_04085 [Paenibacillus glacialis]